jgi:hypothetical protein
MNHRGTESKEKDDDPQITEICTDSPSGACVRSLFPLLTPVQFLWLRPKAALGNPWPSCIRSVGSIVAMLLELRSALQTRPDVRQFSPQASESLMDLRSKCRASKHSDTSQSHLGLVLDREP